MLGHTPHASLSLPVKKNGAKNRKKCGQPKGKRVRHPDQQKQDNVKPAQNANLAECSPQVFRAVPLRPEFDEMKVVLAQEGECHFEAETLLR